MVHLRQAVYFAPRGRSRLRELGEHILKHYIKMDDKLIGFIGGPGSGKSVLIEGMLKNFTLTNDDKGVNIRPLPILEAYYNGYFKQNIYHIDAQFESAFYSIEDLSKAITTALAHERRVFIEHFEKIYPVLDINAQVLVAIGEEVIVTRPELFGPDPRKLYNHVQKTLTYRKMTHTAEELVSLALLEQGEKIPKYYSEVQHGFIIEFNVMPDIDLDLLENTVQEFIEADLSISAPDPDDNEIYIGNKEKIYCTGPRVHVKSTGEIEKFRLTKEFKKDPISNRYLLIGKVGEDKTENDFLSKFDYSKI